MEPDQKVKITGSIWAKRHDMATLPVKFSTVSGDVMWKECGLTSLEGSPTHVQGSFVVIHNQLSDLTGSPRTVGGDFHVNNNPGLKSLAGGPDQVDEGYSFTKCPVTSLEGLPNKPGHWISFEYSPHMPLLRCLVFKHIYCNYAPQPVQDALDRYAGQGNRGVLKCAAELIKAGYRDNARL